LPKAPSSSFRLLKQRPQRQRAIVRLLQQLTFVSCDPILADGVYRVTHQQHRLPAEVTLLKGREFPTCSRCEKDVFFDFLRPVNPPPDFQVVLWTLPEVIDGERKVSPRWVAA